MILFLLKILLRPWRLFSSLASVVLAMFIYAQPSCAEGVDRLFENVGSDKTWGETLADAVGYGGFSKSYALVIGISDYKGGYSNLPTARDAERMAEYLVDGAGFDHVRLLTEDKVARDRVAELMEGFSNLVDDNDRFLFYWSGHGDTRDEASGEGKTGYLPLFDTAPGNWWRMIAMEDVERWNRFLRAQQTLFLLDACFSGLAGSSSKAPARRDWRLEDLAQRGHHVMSAGTEGEETIAGDRWGGSLFTKAVLDGLRGAADAASDFERDGIVSLTELKSYVQQRVSYERREANWSGTITPQVRDLGVNAGEFFFLVNKGEKRLAQVPALSHGPDQNVAKSSRAPLSIFRDCDDCPEMVVIPEGQFMMGSPLGEEGRSRDEGPIHEVVLESFAIGRHEVTFASTLR